MSVFFGMGLGRDSFPEGEGIKTPFKPACYERLKQKKSQMFDLAYSLHILSFILDTLEKLYR